jgi:hypothetical protein
MAVWTAPKAASINMSTCHRKMHDQSRINYVSLQNFITQRKKGKLEINADRCHKLIIVFTDRKTRKEPRM